MTNRTKTILGIGIFAVFLVAALFTYNTLKDRFAPQTVLDLAAGPSAVAAENAPEGIASADTPTPSATPLAAPDFTAYDRDGNSVRLSDYLGKPVVLNFWASWCPPCKSEMPHFNKVYGDVKDDVVFLMVDLVDGMQETETSGLKFVTDSGFGFPVLFDNDQDAANTYGIRSIPATVFIGRDGTVAAGVEGAIDEATLLKGIYLIDK